LSVSRGSASTSNTHGVELVQTAQLGGTISPPCQTPVVVQAGEGAHLLYLPMDQETKRWRDEEARGQGIKEPSDQKIKRAKLIWAIACAAVKPIAFAPPHPRGAARRKRLLRGNGLPLK